VVKEYGYGVRAADDLRLIDENGTVTTLGEVRAKNGQGKVT